MSGLLSGRQPLRGRATIEMRLSPFDFREAGEFWGATDHETAFRLHALFGGTPGYRPLVAPPPAEKARLGQWLAGNVLSPGHALFREDEYVLREDPRVTDDGLYLAVLRALAEGATT